jgi:type I restriction enzyme R subunit
VSIYDFGQSIADGATVPLYYEGRLPELQLDDVDLDQDIAAILDEAGLDEDAEQQLAGRFARQYQVITNSDRLDKIAQDLVRHFSQRGYRGKAMFVAIDKATAVHMYDKVRRYWREMLAAEKVRLAQIADPVEREALLDQYAWLEQTDMAVIVSQSQNEQAQMAARGLDITPHRERMVREDLNDKFKAPDDPLRLVFVCAMWITGFDVPTCSTIYIDKPMRNHTLMQTIARANRNAPGKQAGLIVDYVGVFRNLQEALAIYARPRPGVDELPIKEKEALIEELEKVVAKAVAFAAQRGAIPADIIAAEGFDRQARIQSAAEAILGTDEDKATFLRLVGNAWRLFKAILPDPGALAHRGDMIVLQVIAETIRGMTRPDRNAVAAALAEIERLVDQAISGRAISAPIPTGEDLKTLFDLSQIDFDKLAEMFKSGRKKSATETLRDRVESKAREMAAKNPTRGIYLDKLQALIDRYNAGSIDVQRMFDELMELVGELDDEATRHIREKLTEEELAIFDSLTRPEPKLTKDDEIRVKKIARQLLEKLKRERLIIDWRVKETARATVRQTIREELDELPDVYDRKLWEDKVERTYQFIFERMSGIDRH